MESEIKARIENASLLRNLLKKLNAKFIRQAKQKDSYFSPPHKNFAGTLKYYLRIRAGEKNSFEYHVVQDDINTEEIGISIDNPETLEKILLMLGFKKDCIVNKLREEFILGNFFILIDHIEELGTFVEIEAKKEGTSSEELFSMAEKLGIKKSMIVSGKGYPDMVMELNRSK